jgi:hypothetical protein
MKRPIIRHNRHHKGCIDEEDDEDEEEKRLSSRLAHDRLDHHNLRARMNPHITHKRVTFSSSRQADEFCSVAPSSSPNNKPQTTPSNTIYLMIKLFIFVVQVITVTSYCDHLDRTIFTSHRLRRHHHHHNHNHHNHQGQQIPEHVPAAAAAAGEIANGQFDEDDIRVAALVTKLEQWLKCYRMNLLLHSIGGGGGAAASQQISIDSQQHQRKSGDDDDAHPREPETKICPAHFDGHLCWPETKVGHQISLACPRIHFLTAAAASNLKSSNPSSLTVAPAPTNQQQQQQPLRSVIASIQKQQDSLNGGDINQTQEITSANIQSIKPTGSRAGITTAAMNQMTVGSSHDESRAVLLSNLKPDGAASPILGLNDDKSLSGE